MGSAVIMQRYLDRRVELVFPIEDIQIKRRVRSIIQDLLDDEVKSRYLNSRGEYERKKAGKGRNVQEKLLAEAQERYMDLDTIGIA